MATTWLLSTQNKRTHRDGAETERLIKKTEPIIFVGNPHRIQHRQKVFERRMRETRQSPERLNRNQRLMVTIKNRLPDPLIEFQRPFIRFGIAGHRAWIVHQISASDDQNAFGAQFFELLSQLELVAERFAVI